MNYKNLKLFRKFNSLLIPLKTNEGKNICITLFGENENSIETVLNSGIKKSWVKLFFVPNTKPPVRTYMDGKYRSKITKETGLRPIKGNFEDIDAIQNKNFYIDSNYYIEGLMDKFKFNRFNQKRPFNFFNRHLSKVENVNNETYERCLLYSMNLNKPVPKGVFKKKFFTVLYKLRLAELEKNNYENFPFDKIILLTHSEEGRMFTLLFDKSFGERNSFNRIRNILMRIESDGIVDENLGNVEKVDENDNNDKIMEKIKIQDLLGDIDPEEY